ncbi:hypothetical protein D3C85_1682660 [compost metagenome]
MIKHVTSGLPESIAMELYTCKRDTILKLKPHSPMIIFQKRFTGIAPIKQLGKIPKNNTEANI